MDVTTHAPGSFCTAVLRTSDLERAAAFYSALVGWTTRGGVGHARPPVAAVPAAGRSPAFTRSPRGATTRVPHVSVENVERATADALMFGATLVDTTTSPAWRGWRRSATRRARCSGCGNPRRTRARNSRRTWAACGGFEVLSNNVAGAREFYGPPLRLDLRRHLVRAVCRLYRVQTRRRPGGRHPADRTRLGSIANVELDLRGGRLQRHPRSCKGAWRLC